jgi:hypothetical protein
LFTLVSFLNILFYEWHFEVGEISQIIENIAKGFSGKKQVKYCTSDKYIKYYILPLHLSFTSYIDGNLRSKPIVQL